ncbi:MAG: hypothetical protein ACRDYY_13165 [Acidimicrobiales bacterium]
MVTLEGGLEAFWKRGDVDPPGLAGVRKEVAAYELALVLGWDELLQVTARRHERSDDGKAVEVASIELLPEGADDLAPGQFERSDTERAGVFDALIANTDRRGHNWRGLRSPNGGYRLKLYDHELAFGTSVDLAKVQSSFWSLIGEVC